MKAKKRGGSSKEEVDEGEYWTGWGPDGARIKERGGVVDEGVRTGLLWFKKQ